MMLLAGTAMLVACGGGGNMNFGDNEFPVATVSTQSASSQTNYPATIKGIQDVEIRPKISGFITRVCVQEGQSVGAGQLLFVIDNETYQATVRQAQAGVNQAQAAVSTATAQKNTAKLTYDNSLQLADGTIYAHEGRVTKVSGVIDSATGSVTMIAQFTNPDKLLKSGGSGSIIIPHDNNNAIVVPQQCVSEVQDKHFMYVLGKDNKVSYTEVTVDPQNDGKNYVIHSGLKVGDKYVTNGLTKLQDKMEIVPITQEQYEKKLKEAEKLGEVQNDASKLKEAFSK